MRAGKVLGVQIILNNWFLLLIILFYFTGIIGKAMLVFSGVLLHECAHAVTAHLLKFKVREVELLPFGGVARIDGLTQAGICDEILIASAGPAASMVLAAIGHWAGMNYKIYGELIFFFVEINIMLAVFNLLPALPLDGGRIVRAWLSMRFGYAKATNMIVGSTNFICLILIISSGYMLICYQMLNVTFLFAAVFLYISAKTELQAAGFRAMRILAQKKAELTAKGVLPTAHLTVMSSVLIKDIVQSFKAERYYIVLIVDKNYKLQGQITETEVWESLPAKGIYAKIADFL